MKLTFCGGAKSVTGANYLLETKEGKFLIDCGLNQGEMVCDISNYNPFPYDPSSIDALFVSHSHIDHIGRSPKLVKEGFRGKVFSTPPTAEFAQELLRDSQDLLSREAKRCGESPIYENADIDKLISLWDPIGYHKEIVIKDIKAKFFNAGHILGSASILIEAEGKKIVFSGDLGNSPAPLIKDIEFIKEADYAVIESAYGGRIHEDKQERKHILEEVIENTVGRGGVLMIPAFAMERTQIILYELNDLVENHRIPRVPIFLDSPLAIKLTKIYHKYSSDKDYMDEESMALYQKGDAIFNFPGLQFTQKTEESKKIADVPPPKVIIAGSGMSNGGRIVHHEARYLPEAKNTLLLMGFQARGTPGRALFDGAKTKEGEEFRVKIMGEDTVVRAEIRAIGGYSAHADQRGLLDWLSSMGQTLKEVFVVQGEEEQANSLKTAITDTLAVSAQVPDLGDVVEL